VFRDQHSTSFQIVGCNGFHVEGSDPYVGEKAAQGFEAEARPQQIIDLSKHGRGDEDVILLSLYDSANSGVRRIAAIVQSVDPARVRD